MQWFGGKKNSFGQLKKEWQLILQLAFVGGNRGGGTEAEVQTRNKPGAGGLQAGGLGPSTFPHAFGNPQQVPAGKRTDPDSAGPAPHYAPQQPGGGRPAGGRQCAGARRARRFLRGRPVPRGHSGARTRVALKGETAAGAEVGPVLPPLSRPRLAAAQAPWEAGKAGPGGRSRRPRDGLCAARSAHCPCCVLRPETGWGGPRAPGTRPCSRSCFPPGSPSRRSSRGRTTPPPAVPAPRGSGPLRPPTAASAMATVWSCPPPAETAEAGRRVAGPCGPRASSASQGPDPWLRPRQRPTHPAGGGRSGGSWMRAAASVASAWAATWSSGASSRSSWASPCTRSSPSSCWTG